MIEYGNARSLINDGRSITYSVRIELSSSLMERNGGHQGSRNAVPELGPSVVFGH